MSDLVERLRRRYEATPDDVLACEAADEIERLRIDMETANDAWDELAIKNAKLQAVVDAAKEQHLPLCICDVCKALAGLEDE